MYKKLALIAAASMITLSAHAVTEMHVSETVQLNDGSTLYVFTDGKMGMADRFGRAVLAPANHTVTARDGRTFELEGNEVARVSALNAARFAH